MGPRSTERFFTSVFSDWKLQPQIILFEAEASSFEQMQLSILVQRFSIAHPFDSLRGALSERDTETCNGKEKKKIDQSSRREHLPRK